jgi:dTDP-4-dehydrorhamnose reductase
MHHRFSPTPAEDAARVMLAIAHQVDCRANAWGTYHYCALQAVNQEQFVEGFLQQAGELDPVLQKTLKNLELKLQDSEPPYIANSALDCSHIMATFGIKQRPRGEAVTAMINSLYGKKTKR